MVKMLIATQLKWWYYFAFLANLLKKYQDKLQEIELENVYASGYQQFGNFYVTNGPMEVTKAAAEMGCIRSKGTFFSVSEGMNLTDLFTTLNLQSTWTGIILREV
jgi:hypothetical protein